LCELDECELDEWRDLDELCELDELRDEFECLSILYYIDKNIFINITFVFLPSFIGWNVS
jgi:hypothetical protein